MYSFLDKSIKCPICKTDLLKTNHQWHYFCNIDNLQIYLSPTKNIPTIANINILDNQNKYVIILNLINNTSKIVVMNIFSFHSEPKLLSFNYLIIDIFNHNITIDKIINRIKNVIILQ